MSYFEEWSELTRRVLQGTTQQQETAVRRMDKIFLADSERNIPVDDPRRKILEALEAEES